MKNTIKLDQTIKSVLSGVAVLAFSTLACSGADARSYVGGNFLLNLDGVKSGFVKSVSGGGISAEVLAESGPDYFVHKHIGQPKYEDFSLSVGFGLDKTFFDWISEAFDGKATRKSGEIIAADFNFAERRTASFQNALISEVTIPTLDASSKDAGYLTVKISPDATKWLAGKGSKVTPDKGKQKQWLPANFRLQIPGLDGTRVAKIDSFTIKQKVAAAPAGQGRDYQTEPTKVEVPNLVITLPAASASTWEDWSEDFIVTGNNGPKAEKDGTLSFLSADLKEELGRINLFNMGVARLSRSLGTGTDTVTVELYVERMEIDFMAQFEKK